VMRGYDTFDMHTLTQTGWDMRWDTRMGYEESRGQSLAEMIWWRSDIPQHALCSDWNIMLLIAKQKV
jgi:hypothetical protein